VQFTTEERSPDAFQQPVDREHSIAMCQHAFGQERQIESAIELGGGLYNNTYLVHLTGMSPVISRVGPHPTRQFRSEGNLMRNEYASQPFLAPIALLLSRILVADFINQILERDYLFQTYTEGEQWAQVLNAFSTEEKRALWQRLGIIAKKIRTVQGDDYGNAALGSHFTS
jgi:hypothetical protein